MEDMIKQLEENRRQMIAIRRTEVRDVWRHMDYIEELGLQMEDPEENRDSPHYERMSRLQLLRRFGPLMDFRPGQELINHRVKWLETYVKTRVETGAVEVKQLLHDYNSLPEKEKLEINKKVMKVVKLGWREAVYEECDWELRDETAHLTETSLLSALQEEDLELNGITAWFIDCYGLEPELAQAQNDKEENDNNNCCQN